MKPVLYLDVDGVLWDYVRESEQFEPCGARGLDDSIVSLIALRGDAA